MNIYRFEFKGYLRSVLLWSGSIALLQLAMMYFYPSMSRDAELLDQILEFYPKELLQAFGMGQMTSLATVLGFYTFLFVFVQLALAVQSAYYGFHFLSVEEREKTADFLFTRPVGRQRILWMKVLSAVTALFLTLLVTAASGLFAVALFRGDRPYEIRHLVLLFGVMPLFQLLFFTMGMLVTALTKKIPSVIGYAMTFAFGFYVMNALRAILGGGFLGILSPFALFDPAPILQEGTVSLASLAGSAGTVVLLAGVSMVLYQRRNIHAG